MRKFLPSLRKRTNRARGKMNGHLGHHSRNFREKPLKQLKLKDIWLFSTNFVDNSVEKPGAPHAKACRNSVEKPFFNIEQTLAKFITH